MSAAVEIVEDVTLPVVVAADRFFPVVAPEPETVYVLTTKILIDYPPRFYVGYETGY